MNTNRNTKRQVAKYGILLLFAILLPQIFSGQPFIINLFVMILSGKVAASVMFPLISGGGIILTYLISKFFYKETLSRRQFVGFILGLLSVIFLSL